MVYGLHNIQTLPTLRKVVRMIEDAVQRMPVVHRGPFTPVVNGDDLFLLTRTNLMYSLKPNITTQGAIFGWQSSYNFGEPVFPTLFQDGEPDYMVNNVIREDAEIIYESHPLYALLMQGIIVPGIRKPIQIHNPYGLSHSYGFPSPFISLTQSLDIAAFHACHTHNELTAETSEITEGAGLLMVYHLNTPFSMTPGLSTVGKQAFLRPGVNRLFAIECPFGMNFAEHPNVVGFQFRHTAEDTRFFTERYRGLDSLYPRETIAAKLAQLRESHTFSSEALNRNLAHNRRDKRDVNIARLNKAGLRQVKYNQFGFTREELEREWFDNVEARWIDFWSETVFPNHIGFGTQELDYLLKLCHNRNYRRFFIADNWFDPGMA